MSMDETAKLARQMGKCPDMYWYQLNGHSAQENYNKQKHNQANDEKEANILIVKSKVDVK